MLGTPTFLGVAICQSEPTRTAPVGSARAVIAGDAPAGHQSVEIKQRLAKINSSLEEGCAYALVS